MTNKKNTDPIVSVQNYAFSYNESSAPILNNLSFTMRQGETMLMLGPSGSGKSTLALCLNGSYPASVDGHVKGSIYVYNENITDYRAGEASHHVGVVFQDPDTQFCMLTVEDEVAFGLENMKLSRDEMAERIDWALSIVNLLDSRAEKISSLSGGMKQKLALACVLAMKPKLIILDEPTALLDPVTTKQFAKTMERLQNELQFSLIVIEHKLDHWISFLDRCIVLNQSGEMMFDGRTQDVFRLHIEQLRAHGIWLPRAITFCEQWRLQDHSMPLTEDNLLEEIQTHPTLKRKIESGVKPETENRANTRNNGNGAIITDITPQTKVEPEAFILEANNLSYAKGGKTIINNISVKVPEGALTAIVGPNGAGKSTLSYLLAGLVKPDSGEVIYKSRSIHSIKDTGTSKAIGYVFQNPEHQFVTDRVDDEIAFSLKMRKLSPLEVDSIVEHILAACRLKSLANMHPFALSQGQKRRLSVATMMVDEQMLMILDEPTYGQDAKASEELVNMINQRLMNGYSALIITHDMELVASYADYVIAVVDGRICFQGTPHQLFTEQKSVIISANLELPLFYSLQQKLISRRSYYAASNTEP